MGVTRRLGAVLLAATVCSVPAAAQSARPWSAQVAPIYLVLLGDTFEGVKSALGFEGQLRYTKGRFSLGAGLEYTKHGIKDDPDGFAIRRVGPFVEPRFVIPTSSNSIAPYLSARLSIVSVKLVVPEALQDQIIGGKATGTTFNAGGGLLVRLAPRINLDLGATIGRTNFGTVTFDDGTAGEDLGSGGNLILRVGLGIGF